MPSFFFSDSTKLNAKEGTKTQTKLEQYHQVWHIKYETQVLVLEKFQEQFKPAVGRQRQTRKTNGNVTKNKKKTRIDHSEVHQQRNIQINT